MILGLTFHHFSYEIQIQNTAIPDRCSGKHGECLRGATLEDQCAVPSRLGQAETAVEGRV